jgi:hypothetical protein
LEIVVPGYAIRVSSVARRRDTNVLRNVCYDMTTNMFQFLTYLLAESSTLRTESKRGGN